MAKKSLDNQTGKVAAVESPRRSTGRVQPEGGVAGSAYKKDGTPNFAPEAGYAGHEPVQYSDESDSKFAERVAMFEDARASAGGKMSAESAETMKEVLKKEYDAKIEDIDARTE